MVSPDKKKKTSHPSRPDAEEAATRPRERSRSPLREPSTSRGRGRGRISEQRDKRSHHHRRSDRSPSAKRTRHSTDSTSTSSSSSSRHNTPPPKPPTSTGVTPPKKMAEPVTGLLKSRSVGCLGPTPARSVIYVTVKSANYATFFEAIYNSIVNVMFAGHGALEGVITKDEFVVVCRYLLKARVDHVYHKITNVQSATKHQFAGNTIMPVSLAQVINAHGTLSTSQGALRFIPSPEDVPAQDTLRSKYTKAVADKWFYLIDTAKQRGYITTGNMDAQLEGSAFWLLTVYDTTEAPARSAIADGTADVCSVYSLFPDYTPSDALLACIVQNQYNCATTADPTYNWSSGTYSDICHLRSQFVLSP